MSESLLDFVESVNGTSHLRVEQDFGDGFVRLNLSEAERRQAVQDIRSSEDIVLEMLRNSRDAHASHIFVAIGREGAKRNITVIDDGCGIYGNTETFCRLCGGNRGWHRQLGTHGSESFGI